MSSSYDNGNYAGWDLSDRTDMSDITIEGACFSNETPRAHVFPEAMSGTTFSYCNLDNCFVPEGNTVGEGCSHRFFRAIDGVDWLLDPDTLEPIEPL